MVQCLKKIADDPINNLKLGSFKTFGNNVKEAAMKLLELKESEPFKQSAKELSLKIYKILMNCDLSLEKDLQVLMGEVHKLTLDESNRKVMKLCSMEEEYYKSLFHTLCMNVSTEILAAHNQRATPKQPLVEEKLSHDEQETVRYVAGYIVYSMRKKYYQLMKSENMATKELSANIISFLNTLHEKYDKNLEALNFLEFSRKWTELNNRGGLIEINDSFFLFIRRVEGIVRGVLSLDLLKNYRNEDLRDLIFQRLKAKESVLNGYWKGLTKDLGSEVLRKYLKDQIFHKWIDIRARAYVKAYVQLVKRAANKLKRAKAASKTAEQALRKQLP